MPAEKFYASTKVEGDEPDLVVAWSKGSDEVRVNGVAYDCSALDRLIGVLRRAKRHVEPAPTGVATAFTAVQDGKVVLIVGRREIACAMFYRVVEHGRGTWDRVYRTNGFERAVHHSGGELRVSSLRGVRGRSADLVIAMGWDHWTEEQRASVRPVLATSPWGEVVPA